MIEVIRHALGLCGEPHGSFLLVGGSVVFSIRYFLFLINRYIRLRIKDDKNG